jgi:DNA-binding beta-propeller fold protein YncE
MWGAFGNKPTDLTGPPPPAPALVRDDEPQFGTTHCVRVSNDGYVYVCDRTNKRIQIFTTDGKYVNQVFVNRQGKPMTVAGLAFSPDKDQEFVYAADYGNSRIFVINRKTLEMVNSFGERSDRPGHFQGVHNLATDSKGNLYSAEVSPGNRAQKFVFKGISSAARD